ncbi:MAG TPA: hypothetical protein VEU97_09440, partial [Ktedonobacteraceae bacterium]|nr:hypothetical protein [Ktedonobacteraceae bacterium]
MFPARSSRILLSLLLVGCVVGLFVASARSLQANASNATALSVSRPAITTSCPASGTARAAYMPSMTLGSHATIVYIVNEGTYSHPTYGTLKRYDVVTGSKVEIIK